MAKIGKVPRQYFAPNHLMLPGADWCLTGKMPSMNPVCWFLFIFLQQNVKEEPRKTRTTLSLRQKCSPTSISSRVPLFVSAFKQKQKQTPARSNHKRDDWSWKTIMQKWSEPFLSSPTQNTWCHKCLWQFFILLHKMKKWGGIPNVHRSPILTAQRSWWKCKQLGLREGGREKNYNHFNLKADHFYLTDLKPNSDLRVGCKPSHTKHWWPCRGILV